MFCSRAGSPERDADATAAWGSDEKAGAVERGFLLQDRTTGSVLFVRLVAALTVGA